MKIIATLIVLGVLLITEKSAYDVMSSPNGSAAGLIAMVFLAALALGSIAFIWTSGKPKKGSYKSPVRPLKH